MTAVQTVQPETTATPTPSGNHAPGAFALSMTISDEFTMDTRLSLAPLDVADALRALMVAEINADDEEASEIQRSAREYETGEAEWMAEGESVRDDIDSDAPAKPRRRR